jgi:hypothetical protein
MENGLDEAGRLREDVARLRAALEDVVALALSGGDARQRSALMHRRAVAALSGADARPARSTLRTGER